MDRKSSRRAFFRPRVPRLSERPLVQRIGWLPVVLIGVGLSLSVPWFERAWHALQLARYERPADWQPLQDVGSCTQVALDSDYALAIDQEGDLYGWGLTHLGQLGFVLEPPPEQVNYRQHQMTPRRVPLPAAVRCVSSANKHTVALLADGTIWHWGDIGPAYRHGEENPYRQLAPVKFIDAPGAVAVLAKKRGGVYLDAEGRVFEWGPRRQAQWSVEHSEYLWEPVQIRLPERIRSVSVQRSTRFAISGKGTVYLWGQIPGVLAENGRARHQIEPLEMEIPFPVVEVVSGGGYLNVLDREGQVWSLGTDTRSFADWRNERFETITPIPQLVGIHQIGTNRTYRDFAVREDGRMIGWGDAYYGGRAGGGSGVYPRLIPLPFSIQRAYVDGFARIVQDRGGCYWATHIWGSWLHRHYPRPARPLRLNALEQQAWQEELARNPFQTEPPYSRFRKRHRTPIVRPDGVQICSSLPGAGKGSRTSWK